MKTKIHFWSYLAHFFLEWYMFQTKAVDKIKTHILCAIPFFRNFTVCEITWKNIRDGQATDDNMAQAHFMLYT